MRHTCALVLRVALVAGAGAGIAACSSTGHSQDALSDVRSLPAAYQVVYQVTNFIGSTTQQGWEVFTQTSPFDASDLTYATDPRGGSAPEGGSVTDFDHLYDLSNGQLALISDRQPGPGSGIEAVAVELRELQSRGQIEPLGRSRVAGERCLSFRFGELPVGPIAPLGSTGHDDMCIDPSGVDIQEIWTLHGRVAFQRTAVEVRIGPPDPAIRPAPPTSGALRSATPTMILTVSAAPTASFLAQPPPPAGFSAQPAVSTIAHDPSDPNRVTDTSTLWAFSGGGAVVTVEAGQGQLPWAPAGTPTRALRLTGLGTAVSALRSDGPEIRVQLGEGRWIRVRGTIPLQELAGYASELTLAGR